MCETCQGQGCVCEECGQPPTNCPHTAEQKPLVSCEDCGGTESTDKPLNLPAAHSGFARERRQRGKDGYPKSRGYQR